MVKVVLDPAAEGALKPEVLRALRLIQTHPSVEHVTVEPVVAGGITRAVVEIRTELANDWRVEGASPSGVRAIEPVSFTFPADFPLFAPRITFRADFNRSHPHIQPSHPDQAPEPCLVAGSPRELLRLRGVEGLVEQLVGWLDKAATTELIDPQHGWEPVRRDYLDDLIVADASWLTALPTKESKCLAFNAQYYVSGAGSSATFRIGVSAGKPVTLGPRLVDEWVIAP